MTDKDQEAPAGPRRFYQGRTSLERMSKSGVEMQRTYLVDRMFPQKREMKFEKDWIKLGIWARPKDPDYNPKANSYMLNVKKPVRILVFGATGAGKTENLSRMLSYLHHGGFACVILTDIKDEMKFAANPAPPQKAKHLDDDEVPKAVPVRAYRPLFFSKFFREKLPSDNHSLQLAYRDLNLSELLTLLGFSEDAKRHQRDMVTNYYREAASLEELRETIQKKATGTQKGIGESIVRALDPLIQMGVLGKEPIGDFAEDIRAGLVPVLNVHKYDRVGVGSATLPQVYVAVLQRKIVEAREQGKIRKRVVFFIDESPKFLKEGTLTHDELLKAVDLYRYLGIYMVFAAQTTDRVPQAIVEQSRYILFPFNAGAGTARRILAMKQHFMYHPGDIEKIDTIMRGLKMDMSSGLRQWVLVDADTKQTDIFWALPALCAHEEPSV